MSKLRTKLIGTLALGCCMAVGLVVGKWLLIVNSPTYLRFFKPEAVSTKENKVVKAFLAARSIEPNWNPSIYPPVHNWDQSLNLHNGLSFSIKAYQCVGGKFEGRYSDEPDFKIIATPGDYIYPCDIRIDNDSKYLFCKASGWAAGIFQETIIFQFDLQKRKIFQRVIVDPRILPEDPKPLTPPLSKLLQPVGQSSNKRSG